MTNNEDIIIDINTKDQTTKVIHKKKPKMSFQNYGNKIKIARSGGVIQVILISFVGIFFFMIVVLMIFLSIFMGILNFIFGLFRRR